MPSCDKFRSHFSDYLEGSLEREKKEEVDHHLEHCRECAEVLKRMDSLRAELKRLPAVHTSNAFHIVLRSRLRRELDRPGIWERLLGWLEPYRVPALASAVLILAVVSYLTLHTLQMKGARSLPAGAGSFPALQQAQLKGAVVVQRHGNQVEERIHFLLEEVPGELFVGEGEAIERGEPGGVRALFHDSLRHDSLQRMPGRIQPAATVTF
jgi:anti-sigma factor RsiW